MHRSLLQSAATPDALLDAMARAEIPEIGRWMDRP
jgi:hypothetical protein